MREFNVYTCDFCGRRIDRYVDGYYKFKKIELDDFGKLTTPMHMCHICFNTFKRKIREEIIAESEKR